MTGNIKTKNCLEKWIFFDIDETLIDSIKLHYDTTCFFLKKDYNRTISFEDFVSFLGLPAPKFFEKVSVCVFGDKKLSKALMRKHSYYLKKRLEKNKVKVLPGIKPLLRKLSHSYSLGIITGNRPVLGKLLLEKAGLISFFNPKALVFNPPSITKRTDLVKKAKRIAKGNLVIIGDTFVDYYASKTQRVPAIIIANKYNSYLSLKRKGVEFVVKKPSEIPVLLKKKDSLFFKQS